MTLSEAIKSYRRDHGLSQRQFAINCNLSNGYISMLEKGLNPKTKQPVIPTLPVLKKLSNGMGMTMAELLSTADDMPIDLELDEFDELDEILDKEMSVCIDENKLVDSLDAEIMSYILRLPIESKEKILKSFQNKNVSFQEDSLEGAELRLVALYRDLNLEGQEKLLDLADDLVASGKYIKSDSSKLGKAQGA